MGRKWKVAVVIIISFFIIVSSTGIWLLNRNEITPNDEFFVVSKGPSPHIDVDYWDLQVTGLVDNPINFSYDELLNLPSDSAIVTLKCVSGPYGTAEWTGIKLKYILNMAGIQSGAKEVVFHAADGYTSSLTINDATKDDVLLAFEMNGETLPVDHGYPIRLVVPGKYGYKWVKWITNIEVVDYDHKGYWESRGWDDSGDITPFSEWWLHAFMLAIAAFFGGLAIISNLKYSLYATFWTRLPFSRKQNSFFTFTYMTILLPVFLFWVAATYFLRGAVFQTNHGILALAVVLLHSTGSVAGRFVKKGEKSKARLIHLSFNLLGYLLLLGVILLGLILTVGTT